MSKTNVGKSYKQISEPKTRESLATKKFVTTKASA
jgi:hypothetical protein